MGVGKCVVLAVLMLACLPLQATEAPSIPDKPEAEQFKDVPAPWRDYFLKVRTAERIADPLQRCLAFPAIPNNEWPSGHAEAHCREHFATKPLTLIQIGEMLDRGEVEQLEALLDSRLQRHFSETDFSEVIHHDLEFDLDDAGVAKRVAEAWLRLAPNSAYANLAYANVLRNLAWDARGYKYAQETPVENMRRMSELAEDALVHYERSIALNKRLIPAHAKLINLAKLDSLDDVGEKALKAAGKIDPACSQVIFEHMGALQPRWGGSYEQMLAYANRISVHVAKRPQLAVYLGNPYENLGVLRIKDDQYTTETLQILEAAVATGSGEAALQQAADVAGALTDDTPDQLKRLAYLFQASRFRESDAWGARQIAWGLVIWGEPEWSLKYSLRALELQPDSALGHYLAAAGFNHTRRHDAADREYRIAIEDGEQRQASLQEAASMWLYDAGLADKEAAARAKPYIDRLLREYPENGRGAVMRWYQQAMESGKGSVDSIRAVIPKLDRDDPWQAYYIEWFENLLATVKQPSFHFKLKEE